VSPFALVNSLDILDLEEDLRCAEAFADDLDLEAAAICCAGVGRGLPAGGRLLLAEGAGDGLGGVAGIRVELVDRESSGEVILLVEVRRGGRDEETGMREGKGSEGRR